MDISLNMVKTIDSNKHLILIGNINSLQQKKLLPVNR
jgi:hypothetical protein